MLLLDLRTLLITLSCVYLLVDPTTISLAADALSTDPVSRRSWVSHVTATGTSAFWTVLLTPPSRGFSSDDTNELPSFLREYTKLAPLGKKGVASLANKTTGLSLEELASRLSNDLTKGSTGQGGYFLTGDLSRDIFRDDAVFNDPTNRVSSLSQYQQALQILFDPSRSTVELVSPLVADPTTRRITGRIRSRGFLKLPWKPYVTAYESTIVYTIDNDGLVARQDQTWSKAASKALQESFTPSWVDPPPKSNRSPSSLELPSVTRLFDIINGRRPYEYSIEERSEIDRLVDNVVTNAATREYNSDNQGGKSFYGSLLAGTWILAYLQPGPDGAGIDRRIPFPEFDFNDSFQVFAEDSVLNVGQVLGPLASVQVFGSLQEADPTSRQVPKRFRANIEGGKFCFGNRDACVGLPIQGEGIFDSLFLGERLRIGQNVNGGGARVVQIRIDQDIL